MEKNTYKHRHAVAIPIVLLLLSIMTMADRGLHAYGPGESLSFQFWDAQQGSLFSSEGVIGVLHEGTWLTQDEKDILQFGRGTALLHAVGAAKIRLDEKAATAIGGSFVVSVGETAASVAAITTPVLLQSHGEIFFIPVGYQLRWHGAGRPVVQSLPADYWQEQMRVAIRLIPEHSDNVPMERPSCLDGSALPQFAMAYERERIRCLNDVASYVASRVTAGDRAAVRLLLPLIADDDDAVLKVLATAMDFPSMLIDLLPLLHDPDMRTLAFLHPVLGAAAWVSLDLHALPDDRQALILQKFPIADTLPHAFDALAVDRWFAALRQAVALETRQSRWLPEAILDYQKAIERLSHLAYPERHAHYLLIFRALSQIAPIFGNVGLAGAAPAESVDVFEASPSSMSAASLAPQASLVSDEAVEQRARLWLQNIGALFTTQTSIVATESHGARVNDIVFGTSQGESLYQFVVDFSSGTVANIVANGQRLPFPMTMDAFGTWVGQSQ